MRLILKKIFPTDYIHGYKKRRMRMRGIEYAAVENKYISTGKEFYRQRVKQYDPQFVSTDISPAPAALWNSFIRMRKIISSSSFHLKIQKSQTHS